MEFSSNTFFLLSSTACRQLSPKSLKLGLYVEGSKNHEL